MQKIIDLCLDVPPNEDHIVGELTRYTLQRNEPGLSNYRNIFGEEKAANLGLTLADLEKMAEDMSPEEFDGELRRRAKKVSTALPDFIKELDENGVQWGATRLDTKEETADIIKRYPDRFLGIAIADPRGGMKAVREFETDVKELGMKALFASPYHFGLRLNDKKFYPLYAKAAELEIPVFCYCTMTYRTDYAMDVGRPLYLDEVAMDFPELTLIAGRGGGGGWPWIPEMIGVARRHQNVYINFSAHRPKYLGMPGSGWEMLMQFGNTLLQDRVVFASGWSNYWPYSRGVVKKVIDEVMDLPLKDSVKEKWVYGNAARLFHRG